MQVRPRHFVFAGLLLLAVSIALPLAVRVPDTLLGVLYGLAFASLFAGVLRRWLPEPCDAAPPALHRRYIREFSWAMAGYMVLLFGARTPDELLYGDEFRAFADAHPDHFRFVPCFSRELPDAPHADVRHGYVQQFLPEFVPDAARDVAYLCGNPNMVDACFDALKEAGLEVKQIRREKYVSSK